MASARFLTPALICSNCGVPSSFVNSAAAQAEAARQVVQVVINPPIALYYMQGLNTTPVHAHTALFGVYCLLALGLLLLVARSLSGVREWKETPSPWASGR